MAAVDAIQVTGDITLKPYHSSSCTRHSLHNVEFPLTPFDLANYNSHVALLYAFRPPMPKNAVLIEGLAKSLCYFPQLAGRFTHDEHGYPKIVLNDAGIRVREATVPSKLEEHLPFDPSSSLLSLYPNPAEGVEVLLKIQLTRFSCGGVTVGLAFHHRVGDGSAICHFCFTWAQIVKGIDVKLLPRCDWTSVCAPRNPPRVEFDHISIEFSSKSGPPRHPTDVVVNLQRMRNLWFHFSQEFIGQIKDKVNAGDPSQRVSTFVSILTHVWKKTTYARRLRDDELTHVRLAVDCRHRMRPSAPPEYFGNLVLWAHPKLTAGDLLRATYSDVAAVIRKEINHVDDEYIKSFIDFGERLKGNEGAGIVATLPQVGDFMNPNIQLNSWLSLHFHELDFGGGAPASFFPPGQPIDGLMILVPSCGKGGGVDLYLGLEKSDAAALSEIIHSIG